MIFWRLALLLLTLSGCDAPAPPPDASPALQDCTLALPVERSPGAPFDVQGFREQVWPALAARCGSTDGGCHAPGNPTAFTVWSAGPEPCRWILTFNAFQASTDLRNAPQNSRVLTAIDGTRPAHPLLLAPGDPLLAQLRGHIDDAFARWNVHGQAEGPHVFFDPAVYAATVQPVLDAAGCSAAGCHDRQATAGGFGLHPAPAAGSAELTANFRGATRFVDLGARAAADTRLHARAADGHGDAILDGADSAALAGWIQTALDLVDDGEPVLASCIAATRLDFAAFETHVAPMLNDLIDLERPDDARIDTSCSPASCHGRDRGPGTYMSSLFPAQARDAVPSFESFRCFTDLEAPHASQLVVCPFDDPACMTGEHPSSVVLRHQDANHMRLLAHLHASNQATALLDFAYFARQVYPILEAGNLQGLTCAAAGCHGFTAELEASRPAADLALIPEAEDPEALFFNFAAVARFVDTAAPEQSALLQYATTEPPDTVAGSGVQHPAGASFDMDGAEAQTILRWLRGLRPDRDGFVRDVLVAGPFTVADVTEAAIPGFSDESALEPRLDGYSKAIDDPSAVTWDGYFSTSERINLIGAGIPAGPFSDPRLAYAVVYLINTTDSDLAVTLAVRSDNDVHLRAGEGEAIGRGGAGADLVVTVPPYRYSSDALRVMVKVLEAPLAPSFAFTLQLLGANGAPLTEATGELMLRLHGDVPF